MKEMISMKTGTVITVLYEFIAFEMKRGGGSTGRLIFNNLSTDTLTALTEAQVIKRFKPHFGDVSMEDGIIIFYSDKELKQ